MSLPYKDICNRVPHGIFILDSTYKIVFWNHWLEGMTFISEKQALGKTLAELYPSFDNPRFDWAIEQVIQAKIPQVLSQSLNHHLLPIELAQSERHDAAKMQQIVTITPIALPEETIYAAVFIQDVTESRRLFASLSEVKQKLDETGTRDPVTGAFNRSFMWEWLVPQLLLVARNKHPLSCIIFSIDHFQELVAEHGGDFGDVVLKGCCDVISADLRRSDIIVRYSDSELVALLPNCGEELASRAADRSRAKTSSLKIATLAAGQITVSAGIACCDPDHILTGEELLRKADKHLFNSINSDREHVTPSSNFRQIK